MTSSGTPDGETSPGRPNAVTGAEVARTVACFKWGTRYPSAYVNVLHRAVRDHLGPHRFLCLTDDATGLDDSVEALPLPDLGLPGSMVAEGGWPKLGIFDPGLGVEGPLLCLDIDLIVTGRLEPFFAAIEAAPERVFGMREPAKPMERLWGKRDRGLNTSAFGFWAGGSGSGRQGHVLAAFRRDPEAARAAYRIEQSFITAEAETAFWPPGEGGTDARGTDLIVSFKYGLNPPWPLRGRVAPRSPGPGVALVAFHGRPNPTDLLDGSRGREGFDRRGGYSAWVADYWARYSGPAACHLSSMV